MLSAGHIDGPVLVTGYTGTDPISRVGSRSGLQRRHRELRHLVLPRRHPARRNEQDPGVEQGGRDAGRLRDLPRRAARHRLARHPLDELLRPVLGLPPRRLAQHRHDPSRRRGDRHEPEPHGQHVRGLCRLEPDAAGPHLAGTATSCHGGALTGRARPPPASGCLWPALTRPLPGTDAALGLNLRTAREARRRVDSWVNGPWAEHRRARPGAACEARIGRDRADSPRHPDLKPQNLR
jgi:hypothetical protein